MSRAPTALPPSRLRCDLRGHRGRRDEEAPSRAPSSPRRRSTTAVRSRSSGLGAITCVGCNCAMGGETGRSTATARRSHPASSTRTITSRTRRTRRSRRSASATTIASSGAKGSTVTRARIRRAAPPRTIKIHWGELRHLLGGATSVVGSGGQAGLVRNLDDKARKTKAASASARCSSTRSRSAEHERHAAHRRLQLRRHAGDRRGPRRARPPTSRTRRGGRRPRPAHNEFLCESLSATVDTGSPGTSNDLLSPKTSMIHAVGLPAGGLPGDGRRGAPAWSWCARAATSRSTATPRA